MILRSTLVSLAIISTLLSKFLVFATNDCLSTIDRDLGPKLSPQATIVHDPNAAPRYSSYHAPRPGTIVNVATENDVVETVKYCIKHNLKFLAQGGGHAWTTSFNIGNKDVIINMRGLNQVSVNDAKDQITFGGGAMVKEVVETAYQNQVLAVTPSCSCVGITGAVLGGGYTRFIGHYGMAVDNVLSFNFVTASGKLMTVTPESSPDLWWALRGAGANFGIVTSTTMKAYPPYNNLLAWMTTLVFTPDKIEALVEAISTLEFTKDMFAFLFFVPVPPTYQPSVTMNLWYFGSEADGREAYKALYDIGPLADVSNIVPYNYFNSMTEQFDCLKGQRKPSYGPGLNKLDAATLREIWNEYVTITAQYPGLNSTSFTVELFSTEKVSSIPQSSAAFPHRDVKIQTLLTLWYDDPKLDTVANNFGRKVRKLLEKSSGFKEPKIYVNYGIGDEDPKSLYGNSLSRLKILKKRWDPKRLFSQFNPIPK